MKDKNNIEIKTGDVVEITGAYFKNDNGLYFVDCAPGDPGWTGSYYSLHKIGKSGKISKAKYNLCSWPIAIFTNDHFKRIEGDAWNEEHAKIEVKHEVNRQEVKEHFMEKAAEWMDMYYDYSKRGICEELAKEYHETSRFYLSIADSIA